MSSLIRWRPMEELVPRSLWGRFWDWEVDDIFEDLTEIRGMEGLNWAPKVESYRKNGSYVIKADLPGVEAKNIHVTVEDGCLTIKGERKMDKEVKDKNLERREVFYGSFERSMPIPEGLKTEEIKAKYHDGVLEISAPVGEKFLPKKIEVEEAKS
jgi:HSP20 family protein